MNSVTGLELHYLQEIQTSRWKGYSAALLQHEESFSLEFKHKKITTRLCKDRSLNDYMMINVKAESYHNKKDFMEMTTEEEVLLIHDYFNIMKNYWVEYAKLKGRYGVLFIDDTFNSIDTIMNSIAKVLIPDFKSELMLDIVLWKNSSPQVTKLLKIGPRLLDFYLTEKGERQFKDFNTAHSIIHTVIKNNPLLRLDNFHHTINQLFYQKLKMNFCGNEFYFSLNNNTFDQLLIHTNSMDSAPLSWEMNIALIQEQLNKWKETSKLKNLIVPPSKSFYEFWIKTKIPKNEVESMFDNLISETLTWEMIEVDFQNMLKFNIKPIRLVSNENHVSGNKIELLRVSIENHHYFLLSQTTFGLPGKTKRTLYFSDTNMTENLKKQTEELILQSMWK